jgi:hypothetical protein
MVRLKALGSGTKRIASAIGCPHNTVKRWLRAGGCRPPASSGFSIISEASSGL